MHAGPEIGVAATKSFTSQLVILTLIGLHLGRMRHLSTSEGSLIIEALEALPEQIESVLKLSDQIRAIAKKYVSVAGMLFFGRQFNFPIALEGALKMKEITYLFAEGHPSAELKHGIMALIRPDLPSILIVQANEEYVLRVLEDVGLISGNRIAKARIKLNGDGTIVDSLIREGVVSSDQISHSLAAHAHTDWIDLAAIIIPPAIIAQISAE